MPRSGLSENPLFSGRHDMITIEKEDILPYMYFVCSLAQDGRMYGGISGKSDYIGGIFDRWINIIPESIIFNKYLLPKLSGFGKVEVISDHFRYNPKISGIAPDVIGVKIDETKIVLFAVYDNKWVMLDGAPKIEVKSFKKNQYMVSLRDQSYDGYLVMVETNLSSDYLLPFFSENVLSENVYKKLNMSEDLFIINNDTEDLRQTQRVHIQDDSLGTLKLITVCSCDSFKTFSNLCDAGESPVYVKEIIPTNYRIPKSPAEDGEPLSNYVEKRIDTDLYSWKDDGVAEDLPKSWKMLDIHVEGIENITYIRNSKSSITIYSSGNASINNIFLDEGGYRIITQVLDRSSSRGQEFFMHKSIVGEVPTEESSLLEHMSNFIEEKLSSR